MYIKKYEKYEYNDVVFKLYKESRIKSFNESKSMLDSNNLNDILVDIKDMGYDYYVQTIYWSNDNGNRIIVTFYAPDSFVGEVDTSYPLKSNNTLYYKDIGEYIERIEDYLKIEGYEPWPQTTKSILDFKSDGERMWNISFEWKQD